MRTPIRFGLAALSAIALLATGCATESEEPAQPAAPSLLVSFDGAAGEFSEGVAVDFDGNVYASISPQGRLVRIVAGSETAEDFGQVEGLGEGDLGLLGLSTGDGLDVYGAVASSNDDVRGVWRFDAETGDAEHIAGTEAMAFPNAIAFDGETMYVTDTVGPDNKGAVWRIADGGEPQIWAQDDSFAGDGSMGFGVPLGPNGIDVERDTVYVGLTEPAKIVTIAIGDDGEAGEIAEFADLSTAGPDGGPIHVDGIDVDSSRRVYVASPLVHLVVLVTPEGTVDVLATAADGLDGPASVAHGDEVIYVSNFSGALGEVSNNQGPGVIQIPI